MTYYVGYDILIKIIVNMIRFSINQLLIKNHLMNDFFILKLEKITIHFIKKKSSIFEKKNIFH